MQSATASGLPPAPRIAAAGPFPYNAPRAPPPGPARGDDARSCSAHPAIGLSQLDHAAPRIVVGVLLTMLLAALDQVVVATALPTIAASLGDIDNMSWVVTANLLTGTAVTPLYGKLSDIYGRRTMLLIGTGIFAVGSLACALAPMLALIPARALQGARRRRLDAAGADHRRRRRLAARAAALPGLHLLDLHHLDGRRAARRRLHRRAPALVVDLLDQPAALRRRLSPDPQRAASGCRATTARTSSTCSARR